jgi:phosphate-selective porin OprO and OprP
MAIESIAAKRRKPSSGFRIALLLTVAGLPLAPDRLDAAEAKPGLAQIAPSPASPDEQGPARLKQQVRITMETNALPADGATNNLAPQEKTFKWRASWEGWEGLHLDLATKTTLSIDPLATVREKIEGTNAVRVLNLEELKMSGKIGAKFAVDAAAYVTGKEFQGFDPGIELRRARVYAKGDCLLILPVSYELEVGYVPNEFYIENSYLRLAPIPWIGELKGGQFCAPMSLEMITSSRDITFMERPAPIEALAPGVSAGIQMGRPVLDQRATWRFGLFTDGVGQDDGDASRDYGRAIMRITGLPLFHPAAGQDEPVRLLHLGLSANILYSASSTVRYQSRPESHLAPYVVDTGDIAADGALVAGTEIAWVNGPFSVQGEYLHSWLRDNTGQTPNFQGLYVSASWFLTGESRPYDRTEGAFDRVIPKRNFALGRGGWGAWEIAGRYSYVNLDSADVPGGRLSMLMAGVNWYLHPHIKWRFEYGFGHVSYYNPEGNLNIFQTRVEMDF